MKDAMEIAMGIIGNMKEPVQENVKQAENPIFKAPIKSVGTNMILEKLEAAKQILRLNEDQQLKNIEHAKQFAEMAKKIGWPQKPK